MTRICINKGVIILLMSLSACSQMSKVQRSKDYEYKLNVAENYFAKKKYGKAQELFEEILPVFKNTTQYEDIYYKYAYCFYNTEDYMNAENLFKTFVEMFPSSKKAEEVEYMRAYAYYKQSPRTELEQTNTMKTIALMQAFINTHSNSARIAEATQIMDICRNKLEEKEYKAAILYFHLGRYKAAAVTLNNLFVDFPGSPKGQEYKLLAIKAYYEYAQNSIMERQIERYNQVLTECSDFEEQFATSTFVQEVKQLRNKAQNNINNLQNEQTKKATGV